MCLASQVGIQSEEDQGSLSNLSIRNPKTLDYSKGQPLHFEVARLTSGISPIFFLVYLPLQEIH